MNSKRTDQHPKPCPCGCDRAVTWLDWVLLILLVLTGWLLIKAVQPISHREALHDVPACAASACFGLAGGDDGAAADGGRYVQRV